MSAIDIGSVDISLTEVVAGSWVSLAYTYTAGHPVDDTGCVKIAFRFAGDFGVPQLDDPSGPNYCSVATTGDCRIDVRWDLKGNTRPWGRAIYLKVMSGYLDRGDQIRFVFGDASQGSPGWRVQSFCEDTFEFKTYVDPFATFMFKELPASPELRTVSGPPARALCIAPSTVLVGQSFTAHLKLEDRWGNPCGSPLAIEQPGLAVPGVTTATLVDPATGLSAESNPIDVRTSQPEPEVVAADFLATMERFLESDICSLAHPFRVFRRAGLPTPPHLFGPVVGLLRAAGVAAEINFHTNDPDPEFIRLCIEGGVPLTFGSDAHNLYEIGEFFPHLQLLREAGHNGDPSEVLLPLE